MLRDEREQFADLATREIIDLFKAAPGDLYAESVKHKLILLLQAVDRVAKAATRPVLFTGLIAGYDLIVLRDPDMPLPPDDDLRVIDPRAISPVNESSLTLLGCVLDRHVAQRRAAGGEEMESGTFFFESSDGLHYLGFPERYRQAALKSVGVSEDGLINAVV